MNAAPALISMLLGPALLCCAGCGGSSDPPRYRIEGTITYDGQPVPAGRVDFEPNREENNRGPAAYAKITDGHFETPAGKGTVGGPHRVRVRGFDGKTDGELPFGEALFPEYSTEIVLPAGDHEWKIVVPSATP